MKIIKAFILIATCLCSARCAVALHIVPDISGNQLITVEPAGQLWVVLL